MTTDYSIWLLEYARILEYPLGALIYGAHNGGTRVLPFTFFVLQSDDHLVLVDTGYEDNPFTREATEFWGLQDWVAPETLLGRIGFAPEDVDTVIITHHHFDHAGNLRAFPNATFHIQRREVNSFMNKLSAPPRLRWMASGLDPNTIGSLAAIADDGRLRLLDGSATILPGLEVRPAFDTHTDGSQYLLITSSNGTELPWIIPGDAVMVEENLLGMNYDGLMVPIGLAQGGQESDLWVMDEMMRLVNDNVGAHPSLPRSADVGALPKRPVDNGLHVAEIALARGAESRLRRAEVEAASE